MKALLLGLCLISVAPAANANGLYRNRYGTIQSDQYVCREIPGGYAGWIESEGTTRHIVRPPSQQCGWKPSTRIRYGSRERIYREYR